MTRNYTRLPLSASALLIITIMIAALLCGCSCTPSGGLSGDDYSKVVHTEAESSDSATTGPVLVDNPIDFNELQKLNLELYAWLKIPETVIDYPVAQSAEEDDNYYLHHNYLGNYEFAGTIYSQRHNKTDFSDPNTVLYGHNMLNGSMFAELHKFEDKDFFNKNEYIYVYTRGHILTYRVFAAYDYDDRHILNSFDFSDKEVLTQYFEDCLNPRSANALVRKGVKLDEKSRILTLSTCTNYNSEMRFLVQGVLIKDEATK